MHGGVWAKRGFPKCGHGALKFPCQPLGLIQSHRADARELANHRPPLIVGNWICVLIQELRKKTRKRKENMSKSKLMTTWKLYMTLATSGHFSQSPVSCSIFSKSKHLWWALLVCPSALKVKGRLHSHRLLFHVGSLNDYNFLTSMSDVSALTQIKTYRWSQWDFPKTKVMLL